MTPRARYVGGKVRRGDLERGACKGQREERRDKPNTGGKGDRKQAREPGIEVLVVGRLGYSP